MIKKVGKAVPYVLAGAIAMSTMVSCAHDEKSEKVVSISNSVLEEETETKHIESAVETLPIESEYETLLNEEDKSSLDYINRLNNYLNSFDFNEEEINEELFNVVVAGSCYLSDFEYYDETLFQNLSTTVDGNTNVIDFYYPLAKYTHLENCNLSHESIDESRISCSSIENKINEINNNILFHGYFIEDVKSTGDEELISELNRILTSNEDKEECFNELENVYTLCMVPTDMEEDEWNYYVGALQNTVGERENPCDVYYNLAFYMHIMNCEDEHTLNEFGTYECESAKVRKLVK